MSAYFIIIYCVCAVYMILNFKYDIQMFQQNSYRLPRYWRWLKKDNIANTWRLVDVACFFLMFSVLLYFPVAALGVAIVAIVKTILILRKKYKKPLVFTSRVRRLYSLTAILSLGSVTTVAIIAGNKMWWDIYPGPSLTIGLILILSIFSWVPVMIADIILIPVERMIRRHYINDAKKILRSMPDLRIIGITGSYGKTSTKHYLARILSEEYDTLITPGSFNTPMGVVRTIRENLKPFNQVFICEMGAKQVGDIKEICDIVHPQMGIITAVGPMHLETFKTIGRVCATKFELADAIPADGCVAINNDSDPCAARPVDNTTAIRYGVTRRKGCEYYADNVTFSNEGTQFTVNGPDDMHFDVTTRLLGECNVSDLIAAIVIALKMDMAPEKIALAIASIEPVEHRLSIKNHPGGVTVIDDAFNSNPSGARMAVDVLAQFKNGRRILITPGMVELGDKQAELNEEFGEYMGEGDKVDTLFIVGMTNRDAILNGLSRTDFPENEVKVVDSFAEAQQLLQPMLTPGTTVLYENDLPDSFK